MMDKKYGIPWFKVNFIGAEASAKSLIKIAKYFGCDDLVARTEKFCEDEMAKVDRVRTIIRERCKNKTAMIFVGGSRAHQLPGAFPRNRNENRCRRIRIRAPRRLRRAKSAAEH